MDHKKDWEQDLPLSCQANSLKSKSLSLIHISEPTRHTRNAKFQAGDVFIGEISGSSPGIIYIATQPDMYHAELTYLNKGLKRLKKICASKGIKTVSLPKIGAGLGKLDWNNEVKPLLESILSDSETVFNVYEDYKIEYEN